MKETPRKQRNARYLCLAGALGVAAGTLLYAGIFRRSLDGPTQSAMDTVRSLVGALVVAHGGALCLMLGLAGLRDLVSLRLAGAVLAVLLVVLDYRVLDAALGRTPGYIATGLIGAAFLVGPWLVKRPKHTRT